MNVGCTKLLIQEKDLKIITEKGYKSDIVFSNDNIIEYSRSYPTLN